MKEKKIDHGVMIVATGATELPAHGVSLQRQ